MMSSIHKPAFTGTANMSTKTFDSLKENKVDSRLLQAIREDMKFTYMSEVQEATLPHLLTGADILAVSQRGQPDLLLQPPTFVEMQILTGV